MTTFLSQQGAEELCALRVSWTPGELSQGRAPIELLARVPSDECGCPEELWQVEGITYLIHLEAEEGAGEIFAFSGEDERGWPVKAKTLDHLRAEMFRHHATTKPD